MTIREGLVSRMTVANELSSEVASAILAASKRSQRSQDELREIVLMVHSILQDLAREERPHSTFLRDEAQRKVQRDK